MTLYLIKGYVTHAYEREFLALVADTREMALERAAAIIGDKCEEIEVVDFAAITGYVRDTIDVG
jgi:hypothetical protein